MVKRPTGSGGEPSSPNCGASAEGRARQLLFFLSSLKKYSTRVDTGVMAEETTPEMQETTSTTQVPEGTSTPPEAVAMNEAQTAPTEAPATEAAPGVVTPETTSIPSDPVAPSELQAPQEPDAIQPFIDKAFETIQHEVESVELGKFLRAHIKTFREEWDVLSDTAKVAYVHMMTSQFVLRKAAATRIKIYQEFRLPVPSAQATLYASIQQTQIKPEKRQPVLLMPPNLRPTYSLKK